MSLVDKVHAQLQEPLTDENRKEARGVLVEALSMEIREALAALPDNALRAEVMVAIAVCIDCGKDHSRYYDMRGFYSCLCKEGSVG